ncbi:MAG: FAD-binding oxidoreductase [Oligoflexia bacterium]
MLPQAFLSALSDTFSKDFLTQDPAELVVYGRDWTKVYTPNPSAVAFPRSTDEVSRLLQLCSTHGVAVVPSGGRTGLSGGAVAAQGELVVSLVRMNRLEPVDTLSQTVRVQAGAVTEAVHQHCAPFGLTWPVDFASKGSSHVGGNLSTNAGGVKVIRYGMSRHWVLGLEVVLMDGTILQLNGALEKNNTGLDLRQLFIGTEGTLGIITGATLKLARLPQKLDVFFFALADMAAVFRLFAEARRAPFELAAFECLTQPCLQSVTRHLGLAPPFSTPHGAYVLIEAESPQSEKSAENLTRWLEGLFEKGLVEDGVQAQSPREAADLWKLREGIAEALFAEGLLHKNDISLPISELETFIGEMTDLFTRHHPEFGLYVFGHIGDGNLHVNTMKPSALQKEAFYAACKKADEALFSLVQKHRGSISAEHGIGLLKKEALAFSKSPEELALMRAIKQVMDPKGLLNPTKILD